MADRKNASDLTVVYTLGIYTNPGMARLLTEYLKKATPKYKKVIMMFMYWWPDLPRDTFVEMLLEAKIPNLEVVEETMFASPQYGAKLGWKGASLLNSSIRNIQAMFRVTRFLKERKVDIVHFILTEYQCHFLVSKAARIARVPKVILSFTGIAEPNSKKKRYFNRLTDRMLDRVVTATEIDKQRATDEAFPSVRKSICRGFGLAPNLFDTTKLNPGKVREELGIPPAAPVIGTTTRIAPGKGQDNLINSLPEVIKNYPDLRVIILGGRYDKDQPFTEQLKRLAEEKGFGDNLIFTGERFDAPDIFANYLFAMHLPDYDHLPFGLLECGAMGIPSIASPVGGIPEIIENKKTGFLVDPKNPAEIATAISRLLMEKETRNKLGQNMKQFVLNRYNLESLVDRVSNLYVDLMNGEIKEVYE